ncbi:hypothetical protein B1756_00835 [Natrarchaeobaculum aegyptiacum]|uniref:Endonuclease NucS C-terminal domain-containing protein n=1 Tax=Natrarchaeobaculum aegyptiacum TaxID=745377 RepID=A0A2Z2HYW8_9EURY|nr:hypothetical protein B1756_00835 [Natrarchaeobaculum aegyptiacum]
MSLESPTLATAHEAIVDALDHGALCTVVGRCRVDGSESIERPAPTRVCVFKPDGTALVHGLEGRSPLATSGTGGAFTVCLESDRLVVERDQKSVRSSSSRRSETFCVRVETVLHVNVVETDERDEPPEAETTRQTHGESPTEADLRHRLLEAPDLLEPGFTPLATERRTSAGPVDVYGEDAAGRTVVVELKSRRAGPDAVSQLRRYVDALDRDLHAETTVRGVLVAPSVTSRADRLLARYGLEFVALEGSTDADGSA